MNINIIEDFIHKYNDFIFLVLYVTAPILIGIIYTLIRYIYLKSKGKNYFYSNMVIEKDLLLKKKLKIEDLQSTTWNANISTVSTVTSILMAVIALIVSFMYGKDLNFTDSLFFYFILCIVGIGTIFSASSLQFWRLCMDKGKSVKQYIKYRSIATNLDILGWSCIYFSIFFLVALVNIAVSIILSSIGTLFFVLVLEIKYHIINNK